MRRAIIPETCLRARTGIGVSGRTLRTRFGVHGLSPAFWTNIALKAALIGLLVFGAFSGLQQFEDKAFFWRLCTYPPATLVILGVWAVRFRRSSYPYVSDILLTLPFLIDTAGNALDLYDTVEWWDDANHLVNWGLLSGAIGALARRNRVGPWETLAFVVGFGAVTAILWEVAEYFAFIRVSDELDTAYTDTLGDMALGLAGSLAAGIASVVRPGFRSANVTNI